MTSMLVNTRDDLLMSLLASEAVVDSRGFEVLSAEEVEELKRVCVWHLKCNQVADTCYRNNNYFPRVWLL